MLSTDLRCRVLLTGEGRDDRPVLAEPPELLRAVAAVAAALEPELEATPPLALILESAGCELQHCMILVSLHGSYYAEYKLVLLL